ncbi:MAG: thiol-disulfide isomerase [Acidobacteria bacterium]|nr:MAG: thiol-disulfide isomerase [Acidobacteriota bacterium]
MRSMGLLSLAIGAVVAAPFAGAAPAAKVTFTRDVAPILYNRCVECHRPGEAAPMSLLTYQDARPWARSIKEKVTERAMPPWLAAPEVSHRFANERRLTAGEIETLAAWADSGAVKGDDRDLPPAPRFAEGWSIGQPDVVFSLPEEFSVPAEGTVPYKYFTVPTNFTEDKWVQAAEIRPGNRSVVHHIIVSAREPGSAASAAGANVERSEGRAGSNKIVGFAPGEQPKIYPKGTAKLVKAGSSLVFQVHYTTNGEAARDRSYVGLVFAREPVKKPVLTGTASNARIAIPPGDPNYEVRSTWTAKEDVHIVDLMPHMHVRGRDFTYTAVYPDGRSEVVLAVPRYDFNWQLVYRLKEPLRLPKGSRLDCVAHFDNSTGNKYNPDPTKEVRWGDQTWEEMMIGWFDYVREADAPVSTATVGR